MTRLALVLAFVGVLGCGKDDGGGVTFPDANEGIDAGTVQACNPVTQQGCLAGEKCAAKTESAEPLLRRTTCVPNGDVPPGGECTEGEPGADGYDNCMATDKGYHCRAGRCIEICTQGPPSTCSDGNCVLVHQLFDDIGEENTIGVCAAACEAVTQDCVSDQEACYLSSTQGTASCSRVPDEARGKLQDMDCYGPEAGTCFLNGCDEGYGANLNDLPMNATKSVCAFFCNPSMEVRTGDPAGITTTFNGTGELRPNGPGPAYHCRFINTFYSNTPDVPDTVGMAVDPQLWGNCDTHVPGDPEMFVPGCEPISAVQPGLLPGLRTRLPEFRGKLVIPDDMLERLGEPLR